MALTYLSEEQTNMVVEPNRRWYHELSRNSQSLLITVGDSWTWGDSLGGTNAPTFDNYRHRTTHIYGHIIAEMLDSDFINVGMPGQSNLYILMHLDLVLKSLKKSYKSIKVIFTLTESGREFCGDFLHLKGNYEQCKGTNWPNFDQILDGTAEKEKLDLAINDSKHMLLGQMLLLYTSLMKTSNLNDFFIIYEKCTFQILNEYFKDTKIEWTVARNFSSVYEVNSDLIAGRLITTRWTDIIAQRGCLDEYPDEVIMLSQIGFGPMTQLTNYLKIGSKKEWLPIIDKSVLAIKWLEQSPYNSKIASRHPLEKAHQWWAEYLHSCITSA